MSVTTINTKIAEAVSAQEDGDYATALSKLRSAQLLMAALPDSVHEQQELTWDRRAIADAIRTLERQRGASAGMRFRKIKYVQPDSEES